MLPSVSELARLHLDGSRSPTETVEEVLAAIDRLDDRLGAYQVVYADEARQAAAAATGALAAGHRIGPLHGIPFALKDIVDLEGRITTAGSAAWRERVSPSTATIARRLIAAGGVLLGKTKTVEFALGGWGTNQHLGSPRNPWDAEVVRVAGGSSSGSGVAVASGLAPCAIGTDTGGSVRIPAGFCGLVGLKTTEGLLPTDGIVPLSHTLDTPGPMARTVADATLMFDALTGRHPADIDADHRAGRGLYGPTADSLRGLRFGAIADDERALLSPAMATAYDQALARLTDLGADVVVLDTPLRFEQLRDLTFTIVTPEAWHHHGSLFGDPEAPLDEHVRARALDGVGVSATDYVAALSDRRRLRAELLGSMAEAGVDHLVAPTNPDTAPALAEVDEGSTPALFTRAANLLALSALSLPVGLSDDGLPTAIQIVGPGFDEAALLGIGATWEQARGPLPDPPLS